MLRIVLKLMIEDLAKIMARLGASFGSFGLTKIGARFEDNVHLVQCTK
jgi:hypothetical protein